MKNRNKILYIPLIIGSIYSYGYEDLSDTFFIGANIGGTLIDTDIGYDHDGDKPLSLSGGISAGYYLTHYLSFEIDYSYLGKEYMNNQSEDLFGYSGYITTQYGISDAAALYLKAGMTALDSSGDRWSPSAGLGLRYRATENWQIDTGYRWVDDIPDTNGDLYEFSVGAHYLFVTKAQPIVVDDVYIPPPVKQIPEKITLSMEAGTLFAFDSDKLVPNKAINNVIKDLIEFDSDVKIIGHTDSKGREKYNLKLSEKRASAVKQYFISKGIKSEKIETLGLGESTPVASNESAEGRSKNRRVEIEYVIVRDKHIN